MQVGLSFVDIGDVTAGGKSSLRSQAADVKHISPGPTMSERGLGEAEEGMLLTKSVNMSNITGPIRRFQKCFLFLLAIAMMLAVNFLPFLQPSSQPALRAMAMEYTKWPEFDGSRRHEKAWYVEHCFGGKFVERMDIIFTTHLSQWARTPNRECAMLYRQFSEIFEVHLRHTLPLTLPPPFQPRVRSWLGDNATLLKMVHRQPLIYVVLLLTGEHSFFNPVRTQRPRPKVPVDLNAWVDEQAEAARPTCDFCDAANRTATDALGRHPTKYTMRVSNTFKVERHHSLVITRRQHHPLNFTLPTFLAFFADAALYARQVAEKDPEYIYPNLAWDSLYQGGVSQLHPHIHIMVSPDHYYGYFELLRQAGQRYFHKTGNNLFTILTHIHEALGLTVRYGDAVAFPTIAGKADMEVMFLAPTPSEDLHRLLFFTVAAYHDTYTQLCKTFTAVYPPQGNSKRTQKGRLPTVARLISRGDCTSPRTDYTSFEIFQLVERYHDPWDVAKAIRQAIKKHDHS